MNIRGFNKLSLVDFNGKIGCTIFLGNCNFKCSFCHNSILVDKYNDEPEISFEDILQYLEKRRGIIEAVCITGGEPTLDCDLPKMLLEIKKRGYFIKLDTNGSNYLILKELIENKLVDYVAMDVKHSLCKYNEITNVNVDLENIKNSITYLINGKIDYEFRTTLVSEYHSLEDIINMREILQGAKRIYLQKFINNPNCFDNSLNCVNEELANKYKDVLKEKINEVYLRGY